MKPTDLELHDAVLRSWTTDFSAASLTLFVDAYLSSDTKTRSPVEIDFLGVTDMSCVADFASIATNSRAGNINYWVPSRGVGQTYVYLNEGCIAIRAREVQLRHDGA